MMSKRELTEASTLATKIETTMRLVDQFEKANQVIVSLPVRSLGSPDQVTLGANEIGDAITTALQARVEVMKKRLAELGVEWEGEEEKDD